MAPPRWALALVLLLACSACLSDDDDDDATADDDDSSSSDDDDATPPWEPGLVVDAVPVEDSDLFSTTRLRVSWTLPTQTIDHFVVRADQDGGPHFREDSADAASDEITLGHLAGSTLNDGQAHVCTDLVNEFRFAHTMSTSNH